MSRLACGLVLALSAVARAQGDEPLRFSAQRGATDAGVQDSYIWEESPDYNGNSAVLYVGLVGSTDKVSFVRFDVSALPSSIEVLEGRLVLEASGVSGVPIGVHRVTAPWEETAPTWASFSMNFEATPVATFTPREGRNVVDVTTAVREWVERGTNHGLALRQPPLTASSTFHASEHATVSWRPLLEVLYREPQPLVAVALPAAPLEAACATEFTYPLRAHAPGATRFTATELPAGLTLDETTGELRWRPSRADVGARTFTVSVTDGRQQADLTVAVDVKCNAEYQVGCSAVPAAQGLGLGLLLLGARLLRRWGSGRAPPRAG
jgi:hypothetical protein